MFQGGDFSAGRNLHALAISPPFETRLAAVIDVGGLHLRAVGERIQQVEKLRVAVLRDQPFDVVSPAAPAWLANDSSASAPEHPPG